jgi:hypothetical protein
VDKEVAAATAGEIRSSGRRGMTRSEWWLGLARDGFISEAEVEISSPPSSGLEEGDGDWGERRERLDFWGLSYGVDRKLIKSSLPF